MPELGPPGGPGLLSEKRPSGHRGLVLLSEKLDLSAGIGVLSFSARSLTLVPVRLLGHRGLDLLSEKLDLSAILCFGVLSFSARSLTLMPCQASQREASPPSKTTMGWGPRLLPWGGCLVGRRYPCGWAMSLPRGYLRPRLRRGVSPGTSHLLPPARGCLKGRQFRVPPFLRCVPCSQRGPRSTSLMRASMT